MEWVVVNEALIRGAMKPELEAAYLQWIVTYPQKAGRLAVICAEVVSEIRTALEANPANVLDPDKRTIPLSCARHCEALVIGKLTNEMGIELNYSEVTAVVRAEVHLRTIFVSRWPYEPGDEDGRGDPTYVTPAERQGREAVRSL